MDKAAVIQNLTNEIAAIQAWYDHPFAREIRKDNAEQQNSLINLILENPVVNIETFLAREQALGHLRGLRRLDALVTDAIEERKSKIAEENQ